MYVHTGRELEYQTNPYRPTIGERRRREGFLTTRVGWRRRTSHSVRPRFVFGVEIK